MKIIAYQKQDILLPINWQIEHILPQKWQSTYFPEVSDKEVKELVEHIGNKIPFEKKLNIVASNDYFLKKKEIYSESDIQVVKNLSTTTDQWKLEEIHERDIRISDELTSLFIDWGLNQYNDNETTHTSIPQNRLKDYQQFLASIGKEDSKELQNTFLNYSKHDAE
ncbi:HNH endonuclease family protein [Companilactobacillus furfuricola]|uniref:HNH endonuclease family protein n=1 Tax=Companilactobacillus furfuricola TaxID=1462575 RepID=UPI001B8852D8|nr:HNH endonuclease family protein [Companilactobacillus furfuricola]